MSRDHRYAFHAVYQRPKNAGRTRPPAFSSRKTKTGAGPHRPATRGGVPGFGRDRRHRGHSGSRSIHPETPRGFHGPSCRSTTPRAGVPPQGGGSGGACRGRSRSSHSGQGRKDDLEFVGGQSGVTGCKELPEGRVAEGPLNPAVVTLYVKNAAAALWAGACRCM